MFYHEIGPPGEFSLASQLPGRHLFKIGGWMSLGSCLFRATLATGFMLLALPSQSFAQATIGSSAPTELVEATVAKLPDAPQPPSDATVVNPLPQPFSTSQTDSAQDNPGSQSSAQQSAQKSQHDEAEEQLKQQERQRVMGVMATFNTTRNQDALPLSPGQKFRLFFKSSTDPWPFLLAGAVAGIGQADDSYPEWGQGAQGYAKRYGAAYTDAFIGNFFGNAVLPVLLKEDPRYFQKGTGSFTRRVLWAASSTFWCKRDNGKWGPNYANVGGNLIGSAISRAYYPAQYRTVSDTITDGLTVSWKGLLARNSLSSGRILCATTRTSRPRSRLAKLSKTIRKRLPNTLLNRPRISRETVRTDSTHDRCPIISFNFATRCREDTVCGNQLPMYLGHLSRACKIDFE